MTKAEQHRQWLARRWFQGSPGWRYLVSDLTKGNLTILAKWLTDGYVEKDKYGMYRITDLGRDALRLPKL